MAEQIVVTLIGVEHGRALAYTGAAGIVDNAASRFAGHIRNDGSTSYPVITRTAPDGTITGQWQLIHPQGWKADCFAMYPSGSDMIVDVYYHGPVDANGQRDVPTGIAVLRSVFATPQQAQGAAGAFAGEGGSGGGTGGSGLTDEDKQWLTEVVHQEVQRGIDNIKPKVKAALIEIWQKDSPEPDAQAFQARFDQDVRDRTYEALLSFFPRPK